MRNRGRSPTESSRATNAAQDSSSHDEMLDTDDQEELIKSLVAQSQRQAKFFQTVFAGVGFFAMVISLFFYPFICRDECSSRPISCWTHAFISCGTHAVSIKMSQSLNMLVYGHGETQASDPMLPPRALFQSWVFLVWVAVHLLPLLLWVIGSFDGDTEHFHVGLTLGNLVSMVGALTLLWDAYTTREAFADLIGAKYEHKSL